MEEAAIGPIECYNWSLSGDFGIFVPNAVALCGPCKSRTYLAVRAVSAHHIF